MTISGRVGVAAALLCLAGCVTGERVSFQPGVQQQALVRDGRNTIMSRRASSVAVLSPAGREMSAGGRPVYVLALQNQSGQPQDFRVAEISVVQRDRAGAPAANLAVITYEQLVSEERTRQVVGALLIGAAAAANTYGASRQGPISGAIANVQNQAMVADAVAAGELNLASLERGVIKDNTLLPREWYGGQLHISPPVQGDGPKVYVIGVRVGADLHEFTVTQGPAPG